MNEVYSGYDITLNKEENRAYKGKILKIEGNSYQETREGYNKLKYTNTEFTPTQSTWYFLDGVAGAYGSTIGEKTSVKAPIQAGKTYKVYVGSVANGSLQIVSDTEEVLLGTTETLAGGTFVAKTDGYAIPRISITSVDVLTYVKDIMIYEYNGTEKPYEQYGASPSMEFPSEVRSVGDNINLFNIETTTNQHINTSTGAIISNSSWILSEYIEVFPLTDYMFSWKSNHTYFQVSVHMYDKSKTYLSSFGYAQSNLYAKTFTTIENCKYIRLNYSIKVSGTEAIRENIKLEKGTKITPYSPFGQGSIETCKRAENIYDYINNPFNGKSIYSDGTEKESTQWKSTKSYMRVQKSTKITISGLPNITWDFYIAEYDNKCKFIHRIAFKMSSYQKGYTFTTTPNTAYIRFSGPIDYLIPSEIMVNIGNNKKDYVEYQSQTKVLYTQEPFRRQGDISDLFIKQDEKWYEQHNIYKWIFDGTEAWKTTNNGAGLELYALYPGSALLPKTLDIKSNMLKQIGNIWNVSERQDIVKISDGLNGINISMKGITTLDDFKAKLVELNEAGTPLYVEYALQNSRLLECTPAQSVILESLENIQLYNGANYIYTTDGIQAMLTLEKHYMIQDYDLYISTDGFFVIPGTDIKFKINTMESSLSSMPEAVESSVRAAGRDGDYVLNTTYEPIPFEIVCYTEDNLTTIEKKENELKINAFLNSIKNKTKKMAFERDEKFYNVKYNNLITTTNYPAHLKFGIPLKSSESYGKDILPKTIAGNNTEISNTIEPVGALITINGPATLPIISLNDYSMEYNSAILEGARIEIDTNKSTVTHINTYGVKTNVMKFYNHQFPKIENGENTLKVLSGIANEYNVSITWNDLKL